MADFLSSTSFIRADNFQIGGYTWPNDYSDNSFLKYTDEEGLQWTPASDALINVDDGLNDYIIMNQIKGGDGIVLSANTSSYIRAGPGERTGGVDSKGTGLTYTPRGQITLGLTHEDHDQDSTDISIHGSSLTEHFSATHKEISIIGGKVKLQYPSKGEKLFHESPLSFKVSGEGIFKRENNAWINEKYKNDLISNKTFSNPRIMGDLLFPKGKSNVEYGTDSGTRGVLSQRKELDGIFKSRHLGAAVIDDNSSCIDGEYKDWTIETNVNGMRTNNIIEEYNVGYEKLYGAFKYYDSFDPYENLNDPSDVDGNFKHNDHYVGWNLSVIAHTLYNISSGYYGDENAHEARNMIRSGTVFEITVYARYMGDTPDGDAVPTTLSDTIYYETLTRDTPQGSSEIHFDNSTEHYDRDYATTLVAGLAEHTTVTNVGFSAGAAGLGPSSDITLSYPTTKFMTAGTIVYYHNGENYGLSAWTTPPGVTGQGPGIGEGRLLYDVEEGSYVIKLDMSGPPPANGDYIVIKQPFYFINRLGAPIDVSDDNSNRSVASQPKIINYTIKPRLALDPTTRLLYDIQVQPKWWWTSYENNMEDSEGPPVQITIEPPTLDTIYPGEGLLIGTYQFRVEYEAVPGSNTLTVSLLFERGLDSDIYTGDGGDGDPGRPQNITIPKNVNIYVRSITAEKLISTDELKSPELSKLDNVFQDLAPQPYFMEYYISPQNKEHEKGIIYGDRSGKFSGGPLVDEFGSEISAERKLNIYHRETPGFYVGWSMFVWNTHIPLSNDLTTIIPANTVITFTNPLDPLDTVVILDLILSPAPPTPPWNEPAATAANMLEIPPSSIPQRNLNGFIVTGTGIPPDTTVSLPFGIIEGYNSRTNIVQVLLNNPKYFIDTNTIYYIKQGYTDETDDSTTHFVNLDGDKILHDNYYNNWKIEVETEKNKGYSGGSTDYIISDYQKETFKGGHIVDYQGVVDAMPTEENNTNYPDGDLTNYPRWISISGLPTKVEPNYFKGWRIGIQISSVNGSAFDEADTLLIIKFGYISSHFSTTTGEISDIAVIWDNDDAPWGTRTNGTTTWRTILPNSPYLITYDNNKWNDTRKRSNIYKTLKAEHISSGSNENKTDTLTGLLDLIGLNGGLTTNRVQLGIDSTAPSSVDNYYKGWKITLKFTELEEVSFNIIRYDGTQRIATLDREFTAPGDPASPTSVSPYILTKNLIHQEYISEPFALDTYITEQDQWTPGLRHTIGAPNWTNNSPDITLSVSPVNVGPCVVLISPPMGFKSMTSINSITKQTHGTYGDYFDITLNSEMDTLMKVGTCVELVGGSNTFKTTVFDDPSPLPPVGHGGRKILLEYTNEINLAINTLTEGYIIRVSGERIIADADVATATNKIKLTSRPIYDNIVGWGVSLYNDRKYKIYYDNYSGMVEIANGILGFSLWNSLSSVNDFYKNWTLQIVESFDPIESLIIDSDTNLITDDKFTKRSSFNIDDYQGLDNIVKRETGYTQSARSREAWPALVNELTEPGDAIFSTFSAYLIPSKCVKFGISVPEDIKYLNYLYMPVLADEYKLISTYKTDKNKLAESGVMQKENHLSLFASTQNGYYNGWEITIYNSNTGENGQSAIIENYNGGTKSFSYSTLRSNETLSSIGVETGSTTEYILSPPEHIGGKLSVRTGLIFLNKDYSIGQNDFYKGWDIITYKDGEYRCSHITSYDAITKRIIAPSLDLDILKDNTSYSLRNEKHFSGYLRKNTKTVFPSGDKKGILKVVEIKEFESPGPPTLLSLHLYSPPVTETPVSGFKWFGLPAPSTTDNYYNNWKISIYIDNIEYHTTIDTYEGSDYKITLRDINSNIFLQPNTTVYKYILYEPSYYLISYDAIPVNDYYNGWVINVSNNNEFYSSTISGYIGQDRRIIAKSLPENLDGSYSYELIENNQGVMSAPLTLSAEASEIKEYYQGWILSTIDNGLIDQSSEILSYDSSSKVITLVDNTIVTNVNTKYKLYFNSDNSIFGKSSGKNIYTGSRNIVIGTNAGPINTDNGLSDRLYIDSDINTRGGDSFIYGNMTRGSEELNVNGDIRIPNSHRIYGDITSSGVSNFVDINATGNFSVAGDLTVGAGLTVVENITNQGDITTDGNITLTDNNKMIYGNITSADTSSFTTVNVSADLTVGGNLIITGTNTEINTTSLVVKDALIKLADDNPDDAIDIGIYAQYKKTTVNNFSGIFRDHSDEKWKLFKDLTSDPGESNDFNFLPDGDASGVNMIVGTLVANIEGDFIGFYGASQTKTIKLLAPAAWSETSDKTLILPDVADASILVSRGDTSTVSPNMIANTPIGAGFLPADDHVSVAGTFGPKGSQIKIPVITYDSAGCLTSVTEEEISTEFPLQTGDPTATLASTTFRLGSDTLIFANGTGVTASHTLTQGTILEDIKTIRFDIGQPVEATDNVVFNQVTATTEFVGDLTGIADKADLGRVFTTVVGTRDLLFCNSINYDGGIPGGTNGYMTMLRTGDTGTTHRLQFQPASGILTSTTFEGELTGTATNASHVNINGVGGATGSYHLVISDSTPTLTTASTDEALKVSVTNPITVIPNDGSITATTFVGDLTGIASQSNQSLINSTNGGLRDLIFCANDAAGYSSAHATGGDLGLMRAGTLPTVSSTNPGYNTHRLQFEPATGILTSSTFVGALTGTASNANKVDFYSLGAATGSYNLVMMNQATPGGIGSGFLKYSATNPITVIPNDGSITATAFVGDLTGTASASQNSRVYTTASATQMDLLFCEQSTYGSTEFRGLMRTHSTTPGHRLTFQPSTGNLTAPTFVGALTGTASNANKVDFYSLGNATGSYNLVMMNQATPGGIGSGFLKYSVTNPITVIPNDGSITATTFIGDGSLLTGIPPSSTTTVHSVGGNNTIFDIPFFSPIASGSNADPQELDLKRATNYTGATLPDGTTVGVGSVNRLTFKPSSGTLTTSNFVGNLTGTSSKVLVGGVGGSVPSPALGAGNYHLIMTGSTSSLANAQLQISCTNTYNFSAQPSTGKLSSAFFVGNGDLVTHVKPKVQVAQGTADFKIIMSTYAGASSAVTTPTWSSSQLLYQANNTLPLTMNPSTGQLKAPFFVGDGSLLTGVSNASAVRLYSRGIDTTSEELPLILTTWPSHASQNAHSVQTVYAPTIKTIDSVTKVPLTYNTGTNRLSAPYFKGDGTELRNVPTLGLDHRLSTFVIGGITAFPNQDNATSLTTTWSTAKGFNYSGASLAVNGEVACKIPVTETSLISGSTLVWAEITWTMEGTSASSGSIYAQVSYSTVSGIPYASAGSLGLTNKDNGYFIGHSKSYTIQTYTYRTAGSYLVAGTTYYFRPRWKSNGSGLTRILSGGRPHVSGSAIIWTPIAFKLYVERGMDVADMN